MKEKQKLGFVIQLINWQDYRKKYKDEEIEIQKDDTVTRLLQGRIKLSKEVTKWHGS